MRSEPSLPLRPSVGRSGATGQVRNLPVRSQSPPAWNPAHPRRCGRFGALPLSGKLRVADCRSHGSRAYSRGTMSENDAPTQRPIVGIKIGGRTLAVSGPTAVAFLLILLVSVIAVATWIVI